MTETCSQFATASPQLTMKKPGTVGKPLGNSILKIFDPDHKGIGEIGVKGPNITRGYYGVEKQPIRDGYLLTGDIGYIDNDGDLFVIDRRKDLIISGGENIYPSEIERIILQHQGVDDVCVVGISSSKWGQRPIAFLELN